MPSSLKDKASFSPCHHKMPPHSYTSVTHLDPFASFDASYVQYLR